MGDVFMRTKNKVMSSFVLFVFALTIVVGVLPAPKAGAAIAHEESIIANGAATNSVTTGTIQGGTDQLYIVTVANRGAQNTTNVSGGGLTWTERIDQCSARGSIQGISIWTATGSPSSFTVTVTLGASSNGIAVAVNRYSGADQSSPVEDVVYSNTNGESGACTGGTDDANVSLTTGSTNADSVHFVATNSRTRTISTPDADYTQRAVEVGGTGGDLTRLYTHDYLKTATGDDTAAHTLSGVADWVAAGFVIVPGAGAPTLTQNQYRWYLNTDALLPTSPLAAENSAGFINSMDTVVRLRLGLLVGNNNFVGGTNNFKLQYATSTSGPWTDVGTVVGGDWYSPSWLYRKKITIDNTLVSGTGSHSNLPVLVDISDTDLSADAQADGDDILFTSSNGLTKIAHEIESYSSGNLRAWVKIPSVSTSVDTDFYMYYGNSIAVNQENVTGVWSDYSLVWHLDEDPSGTSPQVIDSTSNSFDGTTNGTMTSGDEVAAKIGNGYDFDGSDDYVTKSDPAGNELDLLNGDNITISFWVKSGDTLDFDLMDKGGAPGYRVIKRADGTVICQFRDGTININADTSTSIEDNTWRYMTCTFNGASDTATAYLNGSFESSASGTLGSASNGDSLDLPTNGSTQVVQMDEFRVTKNLLSSDWIATEYNNQNSPGTFSSVATEEVYSGGASSVWEFHDNASVADDATLSTLVLSTSDTAGSYSEANPTATNPNTVNLNDQGEWDFSIKPGNSIQPETVYYFRLIYGDESALDTYTSYPEICLDTIPNTDNMMRHGAWFSNEQKQPYKLDKTTAHSCGT